MATLFPLDSIYPAGFQYLQDFISVEEESELLSTIATTALHNFTFNGYEAKRRVASFGYDYSFDDGHLRKGAPIPEAFKPLIEKAAMQMHVGTGEFAELLIIEYPVGAVINWHRDAPPFDFIVGISLAADCVFKFRPYDKQLQNRKATISVPIRRRSLYTIGGEARTEWQHATAPAKQKRYSITLRTLRQQYGT